MRSTQPGDVPNALNAEYYAQRATAGGLIVSEATQISLQGKVIRQRRGFTLLTDRGMEAGHRSRPRQGRADLPSSFGTSAA